MENFYNAFFKKDFLNSVYQKKEYNLIKALFNKSRELEEFYDTDLFNFSDEQIEYLLYSFQTPSKRTLITYMNFARRYIDFAIDKGYRVSNINIARTFNYNSIDKYLFTHKLKYLTHERFLLGAETLYNPNDRALIKAIFHGFKGIEYSELSNLTIHDVKEAKTNPTRSINGEQYFKIRLKSGLDEDEITERTIDIPNYLIEEFEKAYYEDIYYLNNGEASGQFTDRRIIEGEHIFRNMVFKSNTPEKIDKQVIYRRVRNLKELTEGEISTVTTIQNSGKLYYLYLLSENGELDARKTLEITDRFNMAVISTSINTTIKKIVNKYRDSLEVNYNVKVVNEP